MIGIKPVQNYRLKCIGSSRMGGTLDSCPRAGCLKLLSCTDRDQGGVLQMSLSG